MKGHGEKLTRKQEQAIAALLSEQTVAAAAEKVGIGEVTLWRWLKLPDFVSDYRAARRETVEKTIALVQQSSWAAATTLVRLLGSNNDSVRLRAAVAILEHANKGVEMLDFEERLSALEEQANQTGQGQSFGGRRTA